jgi:hypothetical protein
MKNTRILVAIAGLIALASCKSRVVRVTLMNSSSQPVNTIEVNYPGAAFGVNTLTPGQMWPYTIKPLETGPLKVQYTNAQGKSLSFIGPTLYKNNEGAIVVMLQQDSATSKATIR